MIRLLSSIPDSIQRFRANPWSHQRTLVTPRDSMDQFLQVLLTAFPVEHGAISTDQVVFEPDNVLEFVKSRGLALENIWTFGIEAEGMADVAALLHATLDDWIDFVFVPHPASFAIYADHDEYLTLYLPSGPDLNSVASQLELAGFKFVDDYVRPSKGEIWR